jgi:hypothetical protein
MAITNTRNEANDGNRTTRAKTSPACSRQAADAGRNGRRDSGHRSKARPAARPSSGGRTTAGDRPAKAEPEIALTIDMGDDRVIEAVAKLLLDLSRHKRERMT